MKKAKLILEDGSVFEGFSFGAEKECVGELVFTTGMNGYIETLTDPSYFGQIVTQTFPLIGNYGIIPGDFEGKCHVTGYIVREFCASPSNFRCEKTLEAYLKEQSIPALCGIDTRALTRRLREKGVMNATISFGESADFDEIRKYRVTDAVKSVSCKEKMLFKAENASFSVGLIDYGAKMNIIRELLKRGCDVTVFPHDTSAEEILDGSFDGLMLSNGPGDPSENSFEIDQIKKLLGKLPVFGICLGHQLTALAVGAKTYKLKYGHRGVNQPVFDVESGRTFITVQNHGYAVDSATLPPSGRLAFFNANDKTCEGVSYDDLNCFTVQFHPEAHSGPRDTEFLFDRFVEMIKKGQ